jgi:Cys-rich repeat protein
MVALLPLGLYLGQLQQIFFSRASGTLIQIGEGNCVTTDSEGNKALKCGTVPLVLYNPFLATPTPTPSPTPNAGCTSDAQCGSGEVCRRYQTYPGNCMPENTACAQVITRACNPTNPQECVDFPNPCVVPPGWTVENGRTPSPTPQLTACQPRPNVVKNVAVTAQGMSVTVSAGTNTNTPTNSMSEIRFTGFANGTVVLGNTVYRENATYTVPAGTTQVTFLINQVASGQATNISYTVKDTCGDFTTFDGGGTGVNWPPPPVACQPAPNNIRADSRIPGGIRVVRRAGTSPYTPNNKLSTLKLTSFSNIRVDYNGKTYTAAKDIDLKVNGQPVDSLTFDIYPITAGQGGTSFFTLVDSCSHVRAWTDFSGAGTVAGFGAGTPPPALPSGN